MARSETVWVEAQTGVSESEPFISCALLDTLLRGRCKSTLGIWGVSWSSHMVRTRMFGLD